MKNIYLDYVVLGGGLAGLSFTDSIDSNKIRIIERLNKPGGLVRSININGFWFDAVVHLLYFQNNDEKQKLSKFLSKEFTPILQNANVFTKAGVTKFPFQSNLGHLPKEVAVECVTDYIENINSKPKELNNFKEWLRLSFGEKMCDIFFYPYNEKMWKRPLESLASRDFTWTIQKFNLKKIIEGLIPNSSNNESYNLNSLYPVPEKSSSVRCMGILTDNIYNGIKDKVHLNEEVIEVNMIERYVVSKSENQELKKYHYSKGCVSTIPLPELMKLTTPKILKSYELNAVGVIYAMVMLKGEKYDSGVLSSYFSSSEYIFSRLIYMQNFDPNTSPEGFWSLMAEVTYNKNKIPTAEIIKSEVKEGLLKLNIVKSEEDFVDIHYENHPYAYNVFENGTMDSVKELSQMYKSNDIHLLGRYGKWQYISISQGYTEAVNMAENFNKLN
jgi:protoporphyrinogen oxidase